MQLMKRSTDVHNLNHNGSPSPLSSEASPSASPASPSASHASASDGRRIPLQLQMPAPAQQQSSPLWFVQVTTRNSTTSGSHDVGVGVGVGNREARARKESAGSTDKSVSVALPCPPTPRGFNRVRHGLDLLAVRVHLGPGDEIGIGDGLRPRRPTAVPHRDSLAGALRPALLAAQLFALLPVDGAAAVVSPAAPAFRWRSPKVVYTLFVSSGTVVVAFLAAYHAVATGLSFRSSVNVVFFGNSVCAMLLFLQLATRWPSLSRTWARTEMTMRQYGYPRHLGRKARILTAAVLLLATVEHVLAVMTGVLTSWPCYEHGGFPGLVRGYTVNNFAMVLQVTQYAHWKGVAVFILNVVATFSWNYTDLFIMLLSVALAQRFQLLNHRLRALQGKKLPSTMWRQLRETYNSLASLTKTVDGCISNIVLLSFASNLYFICIQLLQGIKPILDFYHYVYFFYSFGYLLVRTCVVSLCAASIHDHSREPKTVLYAVPSESYCIEVRRFLTQVSTDEVALTGCSFFSVTRSLMLTVAGTIVTYEIVLVQFNGSIGDIANIESSNVGNIAVSGSVAATPNRTVLCSF